MDQIGRMLGPYRYFKNLEQRMKGTVKTPPQPVCSRGILERRSSTPTLEWNDEDDVGLKNHKLDLKSKPGADSASEMLSKAGQKDLAPTPAQHGLKDSQLRPMDDELHPKNHPFEDAISGSALCGGLKQDFDNADPLPNRRLSETLLLQMKHESELRLRDNATDDHTGRETLLCGGPIEGDAIRDHAG